MSTTPLHLQPVDRRMAAKLRAARAVQLRITGASYRSIARELGYSGPGACFNAVQRELRAYRQEPADELRTLELARLDEALKAIWPRVVRGQTRAVDSFIKLSKRRADLLGLDAPTRITIHDVHADAQRIRDEMVAAGIAPDGTEVADIIRMAEQIAMGQL